MLSKAIISILLLLSTSASAINHSHRRLEVRRSRRAVPADEVPSSPDLGSSLGNSALGAVVSRGNLTGTETSNSNLGVSAAVGSGSTSSNSSSEGSSSSSSESSSEGSSSSTTTKSSKSTSTTCTSSTTASGSKSTSSSSSQSSSSTSSDPNVIALQAAHVLELLESNLYTQARSKFSQADLEKAGLSKEQAQVILDTIGTASTAEDDHVQLLEQTITALGATPFTSCVPNFGAGLDSVENFVGLIRALEVVGCSAYNGALGVVTNQDILLTGGAIHAVENQHSAIWNAIAGGDSTPPSLGIPLNLGSVFSLASAFLDNCAPSDIGVTANSVLTVFNANSKQAGFTVGDQLAFESSDLQTGNSNDFNCQLMTMQQPQAIVQPASNCVLPQNSDGPIFVFVTPNTAAPLTLSAKGLTAQSDKGTVGPGIIFADNNDTQLGKDFQINGKSLTQLAEQSTKRNYVRRGLMSEDDELGEMLIDRGFVRRSFIRK